MLAVLFTESSWESLQELYFLDLYGPPPVLPFHIQLANPCLASKAWLVLSYPGKLPDATGQDAQMWHLVGMAT